MRAILVQDYGDPDVMRLEDGVPDPEAGPGQVVVRIHAAGVNPVDTYIRAGNYGRDRSLPYTPGIDGAGIVESVGDGVTNAAPGQRVYVAGSITGTYAEKTLCDASQVHALPEQVSFSQGAGVWVPYGTAYQALVHRAQGRPGETVLVHGATGGVGTAAVQIAAALGFTVIGTGGTDHGRAMVREQGAHHVFDHHDPDYQQKIKDVTPDGRGVDVILEMLANVNLGHDLTLLASKGRTVVIGSRGRVEIDPRDTMARDAAILGMSLMNATTDEVARIHAALGKGLADGSLCPIVGQEMPLVEAPEAHRQVLDSGAFGKIVLLP